MSIKTVVSCNMQKVDIIHKCKETEHVTLYVNHNDTTKTANIKFVVLPGTFSLELVLLLCSTYQITEYQPAVCSSYRWKQHWQQDGHNQFYIDEYEAVKVAGIMLLIVDSWFTNYSSRRWKDHHHDTTWISSKFNKTEMQQRVIMTRYCFKLNIKNTQMTKRSDNNIN